MNDKEKSNFHNIDYFIPFLESIDEGLFRDVIYPEIDFMMRRGVTLVPLISQTVQALSFKFSPELVLSLSSQLFTDEYLIKEESHTDIKAYFSVLASKIDSQESASALVIEFLFKRYQAAKSSSSVNLVQRLSWVRYFNASLKSLKARKLITHEQIVPILNTVIEHVF
jgi:hypothetical protein